MLEQQAWKNTEAGPATTPARAPVLDALRTRLVDAVKTIRRSKIGPLYGGSAVPLWSIGAVFELVGVSRISG